ncbi:hypothetical protein I6A60_40135 [Frankia sp. AgB1.9]|uniref:hypothetical protein n=1 Tax=unclassified Frankia TaxID=2632575 RepID=UPI001931CB3B|nr:MULTISPECIES: hypothetical protein [unclassified Frankia]MBL7486536.1 hypothetical protein [Frankia sp. AgW1.1]MBL7553996.1 hypothetical protein [Frankia sp. AgB1.9]MBL7618157.1 hypothetical protein [Frankia sp. AgB1.8]
MRRDDFFLQPDPPKGALDDDPFGFASSLAPVFHTDLVEELRHGPIPGADDLEAAMAFARVVHDELLAYGTNGQNQLDNEDAALALKALRSVLRRLGIPLELPFRDFETFHSYWIKQGMKGSWNDRREYLTGVFDPIHARLDRMEENRLEHQLARPISPQPATGWPDVDAEIEELRRHFDAARTPQDYRGVGTDCVGVLEALSRTVYDPAKHLRPGEEIPPPANTKQRIGRYVEDALPGSDNKEIRGLAVKAIEAAQMAKHRTTPTRRDAGIAADAVILLANILRRLEEPPAGREHLG